MNLILSYFLPCTINVLVGLYIQSKILNKKLDLNNVRTYIWSLLLILLSIINYVLVSGFIRIVMSLIYLTFVCTFIFKDKISKIFSAAVLQEVILISSELVCAIIFSILKINMLDLSYQNNVNLLLLNMMISITAFFIYKLKFVSGICNKIIDCLNKIDEMKKMILIFVFFITLNVLLMLIYFSNESKYIIIINSIFIVVYSIIIYFLLSEKSENIKFKEQNEMLLDNLNEYEKMLDYQRVNNHENKNQLLVIRSMISKNNKKALDYLDEIITEKRKDDESLYTYAKTIPSGGLQGLIYQKMLKMKENKIDINLKVDKRIKKINLDNISTKTNYDLCRVVGIIIDNSIDEVIKIKDKYILIYMYQEDCNLVIEVSNKCKDIPDLSRLGEKKYTTKAAGHGYGLSLLAEIVSSSKYLTNERRLDKDIFTQIIKIKM